MPKSKSACQKKKKETEFAEELFKGLSNGLIRVLILTLYLCFFSFLIAGAFASILILIEMYPEKSGAVRAFLILSNSAAKIAMYTLMVFIQSFFIHKILKSKRKKKKNGS